MMASIDLKILETYILGLDENEIKRLYLSDDFAEIFSDIIVRQFFGDVMLKTIDSPLEKGELPQEFLVVKKFMVLPHYFTHPQYPLPKILKNLAGESETDHESRVSKYMLTCDPKTFSNMSNLIDPDSQHELGFFNLYNTMTE